MLESESVSRQLCPTLCDAMDCSPPGSSVHGILQARILEWVAISFSNAWKWKVKVKSLSRTRLLATPWTAAYQAPPSMGFSRQEYWSGVPLPSPTTGWWPAWILTWKELSWQLCKHIITVYTTQKQNVYIRVQTALFTTAERRRQPKCPSTDR